MKKSKELIKKNAKENKSDNFTWSNRKIVQYEKENWIAPELFQILKALISFLSTASLNVW